ncbi:MAG: UPF0149 family protein [Pseudomonadota bacterium]|nr:UPF0149 family protein [Pseudomonadota bacterium]
MTPDNSPLQQEDLDYLDHILDKYATDTSILNVSELDGFLTALVSGPNMVMPSQWLPAIWDSESDSEEVAWESEAEAGRFIGLVMQHMNQCIDTLMEAPEEYAAILAQVEDDDGNVRIIPDDWCLGYIRGVALGGGWDQLPEPYEEHLMAIAMHADLEFQDELDALSEEARTLLQERIDPAARALHGYWLQQRMGEMPDMVDSTPVHRATPKVGRNDPCPCGSGKKFKKCCLH